MFESLASFMLIEHMWERAFDPESGLVGYPRVLSQLRKPHRTKDGYLCVLPYTDKNWQDFFTLVGRADLLADARYNTANNRSQNYETLYKTLGDIMAERTSAAWLSQLRPLSIPVAPVNSLEDLFSDPHLAAVGMFIQKEHPSEGMLTQVRPPVNFEKTPSEVRQLAPRLGEHSREVLAAAGMSETEITALIASGATC